jgi:proteasome lid subunit RPN8/RPN11
MRWTDVPTQPAHRTVAEWREAMRANVAGDALDHVVERAAGRAPGDPPLVVLAAAALRAAWGHVAGSPLERGGLLLGEPLTRAAGEARPAAVFVRGATPGVDDRATGYSLRLGARVWDAARVALGPGEVVVGWFHSHPDIGAFFSDTDRRTQAGFFRHPFSVGWVIDPVRREQAWFVGPHARALPADGVVALADAATSG